jgi:DNA-binding NarL/FixJ family response regulator
LVNKIMIVDDHPVFIVGLVSLINNEPDMEVCTEALDEIAANENIKSIVPDLIIMDLSLGNYSGLQLIKKIRNHHEQIKILVASMHDEKLYAERCLRAGANGYIGKQEAPSKIIRAIRDVLNGKIYLSNDVTGLLLSRQFRGDKPITKALPEETLSDREMEVFSLIGRGFGTKKIASELNLSIKTIDTHKEHIKRKLAVSDQAKLVQRAVSWVISQSPV